MNKVYVLGGSQTDFERNWSKEGKSVIALLREVIESAMIDVDINYADIIKYNKQNRVAIFVGNFVAEYYINQGHLGSLLTEVNEAFYGVPSARYEAACASGSVALDAAYAKIKANEYDLAIVVGFEFMKTVDAKTGGDFLGRAAYYEKEAKDIEYPFPKLFGKLADEYINRYPDTESEIMQSLSVISEKNYLNARRNNNSQTRKWFMGLAQASERGSNTNPVIGGRLAISDCSQVTDGAACVILCSDKFKKENYYNEIKPIIKGYGHRVAPLSFDKKIEDSFENEYILPWTRQAVKDAYVKSNLNVEDMDFFETHDCFTSSEYAAISAFGLTKPGEEYKVILSGETKFDGKSPINPSGGLIGCGHPVGATGVRMMLDLYKQVTNKAEFYQVKNAKNGLMLNIGGSATTNYVFIVGVE